MPVALEGIHKLKEEMAELTVELCKLEARLAGEPHHEPNWTNVLDELADVMAAVRYFQRNLSEEENAMVQGRANAKVARWRSWADACDGLAGVKFNREHSETWAPDDRAELDTTGCKKCGKWVFYCDCG